MICLHATALSVFENAVGSVELAPFPMTITTSIQNNHTVSIVYVYYFTEALENFEFCYR